MSNSLLYLIKGGLRSFSTGVILLGVMLHTQISHGATTQLIISNTQTGLAIDGFDPVAFFTRGEPTKGYERYELAWSGVVWRFVNEGNMVAFESNPEVYAPKFGGYDPVALANGVLTKGRPTLWIRHNDRIYLFRSYQNKRVWEISTQAYERDSQKHWPKLKRTLVH